MCDGMGAGVREGEAADYCWASRGLLGGRGRASGGDAQTGRWAGLHGTCREGSSPSSLSGYLMRAGMFSDWCQRSRGRGLPALSPVKRYLASC